MASPKISTCLARGLKGRCPACGEGKIFRSYLKVAPHCSACNESLEGHRADDFPAYLVIFLLGHLLVPLAIMVEIHYQPPLWVHSAMWLPAILLLGVGMLQPIKGAIIALQWHMGMHDFAAAKQARLKAAKAQNEAELGVN